jgi:GT2 family glycosyltransferase
VIIVNHNGRAYLDGCLRSLLASQEDGREIIVVDNASADGSADYLEGAYPEVRLLRADQNLGFGAGNNLAARQARGEILAFLNPDTVVESGWLEALAAALESSAGLVTAQIRLLDDPDQINTCGNDVHLTGLTLCRGMGADVKAFAEPVEVSAVSGAAFALQRNLFETLGGFDESFFLYMEDTDLSLRARLAGYRCRYVPGSVVYHDYRLRFGPQKTYYQERNRLLMLFKTYRLRTLLVLLPALCLAEVITWAFVLLREPRRLGNKLRAYAWILSHWRQVVGVRRQTQALRRVSDRALLAQSTHRLDYAQVGGRLAARLAEAVFDPLFWLWKRVALALVRW